MVFCSSLPLFTAFVVFPILLSLPNVAVLGLLISPTQQQNQPSAFLSKINSVTRAIIYAQFKNPVTLQADQALLRIKCERANTPKKQNPSPEVPTTGLNDRQIIDRPLLWLIGSPYGRAGNAGKLAEGVGVGGGV